MNAMGKIVRCTGEGKCLRRFKAAVFHSAEMQAAADHADPVHISQAIRQYIELIVPAGKRSVFQPPGNQFHEFFRFFRQPAAVHPGSCFDRRPVFLQQGGEMSFPAQFMRIQAHTVFIAFYDARHETFVPSRHRDHTHIRHCFTQMPYDFLIFFFCERAGGIDHHSAFFQHLRRCQYEFLLQRCIKRAAFFLPGFDQRRVTAEHAFP